MPAELATSLKGTSAPYPCREVADLIRRLKDIHSACGGAGPRMPEGAIKPEPRQPKRTARALSSRRGIWPTSSNTRSLMMVAPLEAYAGFLFRLRCTSRSNVTAATPRSSRNVDGSGTMRMLSMVVEKFGVVALTWKVMKVSELSDWLVSK